MIKGVTSRKHLESALQQTAGFALLASAVFGLFDVLTGDLSQTREGGLELAMGGFVLFGGHEALECSRILFVPDVGERTKDVHIGEEHLDAPGVVALAKADLLVELQGFFERRDRAGRVARARGIGAFAQLGVEALYREHLSVAPRAQKQDLGPLELPLVEGDDGFDHRLGDRATAPRAHLFGLAILEDLVVHPVATAATGINAALVDAADRRTVDVGATKAQLVATDLLAHLAVALANPTPLFVASFFLLAGIRTSLKRTRLRHNTDQTRRDKETQDALVGTLIAHEALLLCETRRNTAHLMPFGLWGAKKGVRSKSRYKPER